MRYTDALSALRHKRAHLAGDRDGDRRKAIAGTFATSFFLAVLAVLELEGVTLAEL